MKHEIEKRLKLDKWYFWIPLFGVMAYSMRIEMYMSKQMLAAPEDNEIKQTRRAVRKYRSIYDSLIMITMIPFFIVGIAMKHDLTHVWGIAWTFWVGIGVAIVTSTHPMWQYLLYKAGFKKLKNK